MSTSERRAREKAQRRREILDAARQEFFERGFHRPTVEDVASRAQVSKGTVYLYYRSKEEILAHLLLEGLGLLLVDLNRACGPRAAADPVRALRSLSMAYLAFCQENDNYFRLIMAFDHGRFEESIPAQLYQEVLGQSLQGLNLAAEVIEQGAALGVFRVSDPWLAAGSMWAALNGVLVLMAHPLRRQMLRGDTGAMVEFTLDLVLEGLKGHGG